MCKMLKNGYYYKVKTMEKNRLLNLNCNNLIHLNNIITPGSNVMLKQHQIKSWIPEKRNFKWAMDVRCIKYHLEMLIFAFNQRKIQIEKFKENFMKIKPFNSGNKTTIDILFLSTGKNKRNNGQQRN